jgi:predicted PolB exonuclease-like 3'-5' exonuclease
MDSRLDGAPPMSDKPAYLIMDIESVVDGRLVQRVRYADEPELTPEQAVAKERARLLETSGGKSDFVPHTFHVPVSVAIAKVGEDFGILELKTLDRPKFRPQIIAKQFWKGWQSYGQPTLVTFNGRFFDLPVLELAAYRYGIPVQAWFNANGNQYAQPRNRFNTTAHLDLQDFIGNQGATHVNGGLSLCAQLVGGPGKMDTKGSMVQELWERGERERIDDYCMCDALDTYLVFLRTRLLIGAISPAQERQLITRLRDYTEILAGHNVAVAQWRSKLRDWAPPGEDGDPFLA